MWMVKYFFVKFRKFSLITAFLRLRGETEGVFQASIKTDARALEHTAI